MENGPILLDLNAIAQQPGARGSFTYSLTLPESEGLACEGPVEVFLEAQNSGKALLVTGNLRGRAHLACARCLEDVIVEVQGKIQEQFSLPGASGRGLGLIDEIEPAESAYADQILNVSELIRQQMLILLPLRVICRPSCKGLCPTCGQNLNLGKCDCPEPASHPAWQALRALADKRKE